MTKIFFYEFDNETELLIYRSLQIEIKFQTLLYLNSDETDETELKMLILTIFVPIFFM